MISNDFPRTALRACCLALLAAFARPALADIPFPQVPLNASPGTPPLVMLVASKDHKMFTAAYNDVSDLDGDGSGEVVFNPKFNYVGLFDSYLCYEGKGVNVGGSYGSSYDTNDRFAPVSAVEDMDYKKCSGSKWSGNFLNYLTTSRMDVMRVVLYGGHRVVDTPTETVLRRAYIPRDGHAWAKEYNFNEKNDTLRGHYNIGMYMSIGMPTGKNSDFRLFLGNFSPIGVNCVTSPDACRKSAPMLVYIAASGRRVWDWATTETKTPTKPSSNPTPPSYYSTQKDNYYHTTVRAYIVQVEACSKAFTLPNGLTDYRGANCKAYTDAKGKTVYKPTGMLHKFGESNALLFGLITGSYEKNMSGGVLRKAVSSFADEVDPETGVFINQDKTAIVDTFDKLMISSFDGSTTSLKYSGEWVGKRIMKEKEFPDWGNPVGEMMYEALRYFSGAGPTSAFDVTGSGSLDARLGLKRADWDKPYLGKVPWCARPNLFVLADTTPSFDSDQIPGANFSSCMTNSGELSTSTPCVKGGGSGGSFDTLNVTALANKIGDGENIRSKNVFIGQHGGDVDWSPRPKRVNDLGRVRGLAPEEPGKEGSYYSAAVAYYGRTVGIETEPGKEKQKVTTYAAVFPPQMPRIESTLDVQGRTNTVTIVPFAKTVYSGQLGIGAYSTRNYEQYFQPTAQITNIFAERFYMRDPDNANLLNAKFVASFEDVEQGGDYDSDFLVEYDISQDSKTRQITIKVTPKTQGSKPFSTINAGYSISGTDNDGTYLVTQNRDTFLKGKDDGYAYYLNSPSGKVILSSLCGDGTIGACNAPKTHIATFMPKQDKLQSAILLKDPLWYAAKWGGFRNRTGNPNAQPTDENASYTWDADGDGTPDNYFSLRNPADLQDGMERAFNAMKEGVVSSGNIDVSSDTLSSSGTLAFSTEYAPLDWGGDLLATTLNGSKAGKLAWRAAEQLPSAASRRIFTRSNAQLHSLASTGVAFTYGNLNSDQQAALTSAQQAALASSTSPGSDIVDFVRGSPNKETKNRRGRFRNRYRAGTAQSPLGDSPTNAPLYVKDTHTVYLGANDGMLHAFDAANGKELFAYIPSAVIPKLPKLADPSYMHEYYVDGDVAVTSVQNAGGNYLVGALGRGGRGVYGLDVSSPGKFSGNSVKWEFNGPLPGSCSGKADYDDMGFVIGRPLVARLNDGNVYAIVHNGYNSCSGVAALYILDVKTGALKAKLVTPAARDNGLSAPGALDIDGNETIDYVYAGDLQGNLWRFDLRSDKPGDWAVDTRGLSKPLFTARNGQNQVQSITAPPVALLDKGNNAASPRIFVFFGTGRFLSAADKDSKEVQSWYGLIDDGQTPLSRTHLVRRRFNVTHTLPNGQRARAIEEQRDATDMRRLSGWVIDFDLKEDVGERVIGSALLVQTDRGTLVEIPSIVPVGNDPCLSGGRGYINFVDAFTGARFNAPFLDLNGDGIIDEKDTLPGDQQPSSIDPQTGMPGDIKLVGEQNVSGGTNGNLSNVKVELGSFKYRGRLSWREIMRE